MLKRSVVLGGIPLLVLLLGMALFRWRTGERSPDRRSDASVAATLATPAAMGANLEPAILPAGAATAVPEDPSVVSRLLHERVRKLQKVVEREIAQQVRTRGGQATLDLIRDSIRDGTLPAEDRAKAAYLVRLIPFVAKEDPSCTAAAISLELQLLARRGADDYVRFQAVAGLAGVPSCSMSVGYNIENPVMILCFHADREDEDDGTLFEASLRNAAGKDAAVGVGLLTAVSTDEAEQVRELAARGLGLLRVSAATETLYRVARADEDGVVQAAAVEALAVLDPGHFLSFTRDLAATGSVETRATAIELLPRTVPYGPELSQLLVEASTSPELAPVRSLVAKVALDVAHVHQADELLPGLYTMLQRDGPNLSLINMLTRTAVEWDMAGFLPSFKAAEAALTPEDNRRPLLAEAIRKLSDIPHYSPLARQIKDITNALAKLDESTEGQEGSPIGEEALAERRKQLFAERERLQQEYDR